MGTLLKEAAILSEVANTKQESQECSNYSVVRKAAKPIDPYQKESKAALLLANDNAKSRLEQYHRLCEEVRSVNYLRAPVVCVYGPDRVGKSALIDYLRGRPVQSSKPFEETQKSDLFEIPIHPLCGQILKENEVWTVGETGGIPGLIVIETSENEILKNLTVGGSPCYDLVLFMIDLTSGISSDTIGSIRLLVSQKIPFLIVLNKIDRLNTWQQRDEKSFQAALEQQDDSTRDQFNTLSNHIIVQFAGRAGCNVVLHYKKGSMKDDVSMIPLSARTGEGVTVLLSTLFELCRTTLANRLAYSTEVQATVTRIKYMGGRGAVIEVLLLHGRLSVGDQIILAGQEGPLRTRIRELLTVTMSPERHTQAKLENHDFVEGASSVQIVANDLDVAVPGFELFAIRHDDEGEYLEQEISKKLENLWKSQSLARYGVHVQASSIGSLQAILKILQHRKIPYSGVNIGIVHRKDVRQASAQVWRDQQFRAILAYDVPVGPDSEQLAKKLGVKILEDTDMYHLCEQFTQFQRDILKENPDQDYNRVVPPCRLKIQTDTAYYCQDLFICDVVVDDGSLMCDTEIKVGHGNLGRVVSISSNHKPLRIARRGDRVCVKIAPPNYSSPLIYGRHFSSQDILSSNSNTFRR